MNRRSYETDAKGSVSERRTSEAANQERLAEILWMSGVGVARAQVQADGTIKGVRFSDDGDGSLVEVWIKRPTK